MKKTLIVLSVLCVMAIPTLVKAGDTECDKGMALVCVLVDDQSQETILTGKSGKVLPVCPAQEEQSIKLACKAEADVKAAEKVAKAEIAKAKKGKKAKTKKPTEPAPAPEQPKPSDPDKVKEAVDAAIAPLKGETMEAGSTSAAITVDPKPAYDAGFKGGHDGASEALKGLSLKCPEGSKGGGCDFGGVNGKLDELQKKLDEMAAKPAHGSDHHPGERWEDDHRPARPGGKEELVRALPGKMRRHRHHRWIGGGRCSRGERGRLLFPEFLLGDQVAAVGNR